MLVQFYTAIIESILTSSITVWFAGATVRDKRRLQRIVRSAEKVIGCSLPSLQDLYVARARGARVPAAWYGTIVCGTQTPSGFTLSQTSTESSWRSHRTKQGSSTAKRKEFHFPQSAP
uniref:Alkylated DNA repair protein AlkB homologue 8 N-terminal domain-containing protein n=1 Tax=Knipowitschia caucasica TaxID=637954 RepID=A0AAV2JWV6_KNICA